MKTWIPVVIESPFSGDVERNKEYLRRAIRDCRARGETPYASHRMLTDALDDLDPAERADGIEMGFAFRALTVRTTVYEDYGVSGGMRLGIEHAESIRHPIVFRLIGKNE